MIKKSSKKSSDPAVVTAIMFFLFLAIVVFFIHLRPRETPAAKPVVKVKAAGAAFVRKSPYAFGAPLSGKVAIIIDDWGQSLGNCKYLKEIREPLEVSILPGLRHTKDVARCAGLNGKMTMLHLPLEAMHNYDFYPPNYIIKTTMPKALVEKILEEDLAQLPSIKGVNNHMGSKATEDVDLMRIILKRLKQRGLFFVDSMTAHQSVCERLADEMDLTFGKRDVFLDNINTRQAIIGQFRELAQKARRRGYAVAIGHDRHLTMQVLEEEIPWLEAQGLKIVSIKELLKTHEYFRY